MKKVLLIIVLLIPFSLAAASFDVVSAHYDISVAENGVRTVTETLVYDFHERAHGILLDIYLNGGEAEVIHVSENWEARYSGDVMTVRIGKEDELVSGIVSYEVTYFYTPPADRSPDYDEFYNDICFTTDYSASNVTFSIAFPADIDENRIWVSAGPYGSYNPVDFHLTDGRILAGRVDQLAPGEGLTVRVEMDEGYFLSPVDHSLASFIIALVTTLALAAVLCVLYFRFGRDEDPVIVANFNLPEDMTPLDMGYLYDSSDDSRDYASMIYYWADMGCLSIEEKEDDVFWLHKIKEPVSDRTYEIKLFDAVFKNGDDICLDDLRLYEAVEREVRPMLRRKYSKGEKNLVDDRTSTVQNVSFVLTIAYVVAMSVCISINNFEFGFFAFAVLAFQFIFCALVSYSLNRKVCSLSQKVFYVLFALAASIICLVFIRGICFSAGISETLVQVMACIVIAGVFILTFLSSAMIRRSVYAQKVLGEILGYRDFLEKVEMDKLHALIEEDPEYFYHNLAYAMVLGLEKEWSAKAEGAFVPQASWYTGSGDLTSCIFYYAMADRLNRRFRAYCITPPQTRRGSQFSSHGPSHSGFSGFSGGGIGGSSSRSW